MVFKIILITLLSFSKISYSSIVYDKNNISINEIEINNYIKLYENNYQEKLDNNKAIKDIVLMKNTINFLLKKNPVFMTELDKNINMEYGDSIFKNSMFLNFLRFQKIRNEFILEYFNNQFSLEELEIVLSSLKDFKVPISKNNCMTIEKLHHINDDKSFISDFFKNLKTNQKNFKIKINNNNYHICMSNEDYSEIENLIINFIKNKTEAEFNQFIYGKIN